jgi:hypothetical protein
MNRRFFLRFLASAPLAVPALIIAARAGPVGAPGATEAVRAGLMTPNQARATIFGPTSEDVIRPGAFYRALKESELRVLSVVKIPQGASP